MEVGIYRNDQSSSVVGGRVWIERAEGLGRGIRELQYQALKKCINATRGSQRELVNQIAKEESSRMMLDAAQARVIE